jgi:hypothetical protein
MPQHRERLLFTSPGLEAVAADREEGKGVQRAAMRTIALIGAILILTLPEMTGNASAARVGQTCGGILGVKCDQGLWCDERPGKCGANHAFGKCIEVPGDVCQVEKVVGPVCGCDGNTYSNNCERQSVMVGLKSIGRCK